MPTESRTFKPLVALLAIGCGSSSGTGPSPASNCDSPLPLTLAVGEHQLVDARLSADCLRLVAGSAAAEYLVIPYSGEGQESAKGAEAEFRLTTRIPAVPAGLVATVPGLSKLSRGAGSAHDFHAGLRKRTNELVTAYPPQPNAGGPPRIVAPPELGAEEPFNVCSNSSCDTVEEITATARFVGSEGVIWIDNSLIDTPYELPTNDLDYLGTLFDEYLLPIDTAAFGSVSDIDGNQLVDIVITPKVNQLTEDCDDGRVVGFFFGGDLLSSYPGSNRREVFFAVAPQPASEGCPPVSRQQALRALPPVLIHELQHMISFNQHVLIKGRDDETVWLNEGLSHFAEELGHRLIPDSECPHSSSCYALFARGNAENVNIFLGDPEATHLVAPSDGISLAGRGAAWLFVRWFADHFGNDGALGTSATRSILSSNFSGAASVASISGIPFGQLVGEWLLANYLDNLPGFQQTGRLNYASWDFRQMFQNNFPGGGSRTFPLVPGFTSGASQYPGILRGGSGYYMRVSVTGGGPGVDVQLTGSNEASQVSASVSPRFAVVRIN